MDQPSDNSNKSDSSSSSQFDYSGLIPPESMGGNNPSQAPQPASNQNPVPDSAPSPTPAPLPEDIPPPASNTPPPPPPPPPLELPKNDATPISNQSQTDDLDLDTPRQIPTAPGSVPHHSSFGSWILIIVLTILLALAILIFLSWKGLVNVSVLNQFWGKTSSTPTPVASITATPTTQSNDSVRKQNVASIAQALKKYYADNAKYPLSTVMIKTSDSQSVLAQALVPAYIPALPDDPLAPAYYYGYKSDGKTFEITAVLEDKTDVSGALQGNLNIYKVTGTTGR